MGSETKERVPYIAALSGALVRSSAHPFNRQPSGAREG